MLLHITHLHDNIVREQLKGSRTISNIQTRLKTKLGMTTLVSLFMIRS